MGNRGPQQTLEQRILLTSTLCLMALGAVMVYSASSATTVLEGHGTGTSYLVRYLVFGALGLLAMRLLARRGVALVPRITGPLLFASFVLVVAVHIPHVGVSINGGRRWVGAGVLRFEPAELMKLALVLYCATLIARRPRRVLSVRALARPLLLVCGAACTLVAVEPDIGSAMVIAMTVCAMLVAAGMPPRQLAKLAGGVAFVVVVYALARPYARARLTSFINPWAHATGSGFQSVQAQIALGSGGLFGVGPGQSVQKAFFLPEAPTDFILAVIGEELGVLGVGAALSLYGLIAYAGLRAARQARSLYSALIAVGATALIVSQALLNSFAVLGMAPLTGVPLPLVSYGSTSLIVTLAAMGLLLGVAGGQSAHLRALPSDQRRRSGGAPARASRGAERAASSASGAVAGRAGRAESAGLAGAQNTRRRRAGAG
ncbi:MAG: cell division protein FtsW [Acidobacteriota bacterium]|nr:cell division protein FtsW [Acidobacteriota bacterium]